VDTGSREENASKQKPGASIRRETPHFAFPWLSFPQKSETTSRWSRSQPG